jgi:hypothetical protein
MEKISSRSKTSHRRNYETINEEICNQILFQPEKQVLTLIANKVFNITDKRVLSQPWLQIMNQIWVRIERNTQRIAYYLERKASKNRKWI